MTPPLNPALARAVARWSAEDAEAFQERAALIQFDGGFSREEAEERAAIEVGRGRVKAGKGGARG